VILWAQEAYQYASDHADTLLSIEFHGEDVCRVVLEGDPDVDPELGAPDDTWYPELPTRLAEINAALEAKGWPAMSPFWTRTIALCYFANRKNQIFRVGRRGGKTTAICRVVVYEVLYGDHVVPPGDIGVFCIISALLPQAKERIKTIDKILEDLGVEHKTIKEEITFQDMNRAIRAYAATAAAVVSFTSIGALCDEEAHWRDDKGSNPAAEILGNLRPTMATMPNAKLWHTSAPWSTLDVHYEAFEKGIQPDQICFYAPTWIANPTLTEEGTRALEPDEPTWERQYKAIPSASDETKFFNAAFIDAAAKVSLKHLDGMPACGADLAFRKDSAACVVSEGGEDWLRLAFERDWVPGRLPLRPTEVIKEAIGIAVEYKCESVCTDLHYIESVREETDLKEIGLTEFPNDAERIGKVYVKLRVMLARGKIDLSRASVKLIRQLKETTVHFTEKGMHVQNPRTVAGHGDLVSALAASSYSLGTAKVSAKAAVVKRRIQSDRHGAGINPGWSETAPDD
jgi:hypothetical protein